MDHGNYQVLVRAAGDDSPCPCEIDGLDNVHEQVAAGSLVWLDVATRDPDEIDELGLQFGFDPAAIEDVLDLDYLPKSDLYDDHLFVVLHALITSGDRLGTHEVDCFVRGNLLVTVHSVPVRGIEWLWDAVQTHPHLAEHGADELFAQLSEVIGRRYIEVITELERRVDALADPALDADQQVLAEIQVLRREESTVRRVLPPQRLVLAGLRTNNAHPILSDSALRILGDAYDVHNLVVESLATTRGLMTDTLDTYRGASAERQAAAATVLTVYAAILLPLTLITGWYGMNFAELPAAERQWGWMAVSAVMAAVVLVSWVVFIWTGLLRRPRLRLRGARRSRIVKGLATTAMAPVRPFTMLRRPAAQFGATVRANLNKRF